MVCLAFLAEGGLEIPGDSEDGAKGKATKDERDGSRPAEWETGWLPLTFGWC